MKNPKLSKRVQEILTVQLLGKSFTHFEHKDGKLVATTFYEFEGKTYHFEKEKEVSI